MTGSGELPGGAWAWITGGRFRTLSAALLALLAVLSAAGCSGPRSAVAVGAATSLECAPFAREATGLKLHGDAAGWWDQAGGRYGRGQRPMPGGVLVFRRSGRLAAGHVAVVTAVVSARQILVTQANWVRRRVTRDDPVIDVSPQGDWSQVRVWWAPSAALGAGVYPTYGFIAPPAGNAHATANRLQAIPGLAMSSFRDFGGNSSVWRNDG